MYPGLFRKCVYILSNIGHVIYVLDSFFEFNDGVYVWIGLTKKGNFIVLYVFNTIFQYEFNHDGHYVIWWLFLPHHMIWVCSGTIFRGKFSGGSYNVLRETDLAHCMIWVCLGTIFQGEFSGGGYNILQETDLGYGHHHALFLISHSIIMHTESSEYYFLTLYNMGIIWKHFPFHIQL
jgi:hypothetical protein